MVIRSILFLALFTCSGCFNGNNSSAETDLRDFCGTVDTGSSRMKGPDVFQARCATCHMFEKDITGPKMKGILDRVPSEEWLRAFITNQDSLIQINDAYTLEIMKWSPVKWNHNVSDISQEDMDTLMNFITQ